MNDMPTRALSVRQRALLDQRRKDFSIKTKTPTEAA